MTDAERHLWRHLCRRQLGGFKFSRQIPIGPFVCDFACREAKLAIELDGGQHDRQEYSDSSRSRMLADDGYRVIRFWNHDVLGNVEGVLTAILDAVHSTPPPTPPASGRGAKGAL